MASSNFKQSFQAYAQWRTQISRTVNEYRAWLETQGLFTTEIGVRIANAMAGLEEDRLTIAVVAEVSRGKTELINAIFFADYGKRLLPSAAGRTTMCPTELMWDAEQNEAYVRLLPIETRGLDETISELKKKKHSSLWIKYALNVDSSDQIESVLREIIQIKQVTIPEASRLGLYSNELQSTSTVNGHTVEIPRWRHALISFPHPLLKQGLVLLDTPGLNALGSEPELTLSTLPSAQLVLFVLSADTGVTRSDMDMWQHHIKGFHNNRQRGLVVALNKIDTLWDELKFPHEIRKIIANQKALTAKTLGIVGEVIFPVSAQKALVAKIKNDPRLLEESALLSLETYLSQDVLSMRQQIMLDTVERDVGQLIEDNRNLIAQQISNVKKQLSELESLRDKSEDVIQQLLEKTRSEQAQYLEVIDRFHTNRASMQQEVSKLKELLDIKQIDTLIDATYNEIVSSWTTRGITWAMKTLFDELRQIMQAIVTNAEQIRKTVRNIYQGLQAELGLSNVQPPKFSTMKYRVDLELLYQEADAFRRSPTLTVTTQTVIAKRFYSILASKGREIFQQVALGIDEWLNHALEPLVQQIQEHKDMMEKRLVNLQKIGRSKNTLQTKIEDLEGQYVDLARQLTTLRNMYNSIHLSRPVEENTRHHSHSGPKHNV
jgi:hypothetical protein